MGAAGGAGEFGHMVIDPAGQLCRCGNRGCFEMTASLRATMRRAGLQQLNRAAIEEVVAKAVAGDIGSRRLVTATAAAVGLGLAMIGTVLNPKLIVVGGSLAQAGELMLAPLVTSYDQHTLVKRDDVPAEARTRIVTGKLLEYDSCLGAVGLVLRQHDRTF